ncbi:MAG: hypothetical protein ABIN56_09510 [Dokdonella sp.]
MKRTIPPTPLARYVAPLLAVLFVGFTLSAQAFFDPPCITPTAPIAGDIVSVNVVSGVCDTFIQRVGYPQISQQGNAIDLLMFGDHFESGDERCICNAGTLTQLIGTFPPGTCTLTIQLDYLNAFGVPSYLQVDTSSFTVAAPAATAEPAPATSPRALLFLALPIAGAVASRMREHGAGFIYRANN